MYSYVFDTAKAKWMPWLDTVEAKAPEADAEYSSIIVQTVDTVRYSFLLNQLVRRGRPCLFVGPTGTGKSVYVKRHLAEGLPEEFVHMLMTFSAQTSANMSQDIVDGRLDKRRKGVYGPPPAKRMVVFVDDLNMPEVRSCQDSALELTYLQLGV